MKTQDQLHFTNRCFLFLQGPHGSFFYELGKALYKKGCRVLRVNLCGGDLIDWHAQALNYRGRGSDWSLWISNLIVQEQVSDLMIFGDWRPYHRDAVHIARLHNVQIWAFDEGYIRPYWITMERDGVNGNSHLAENNENAFCKAEGKQTEYNFLPCNSSDKKQNLKTISLNDTAKANLTKSFDGSFSELLDTNVTGPLHKRQLSALKYCTAQVLMSPLYPFYHTHRPYGVLHELVSGWIPRILHGKKRHRKSIEALKKLDGKTRYFLFPLQLDSDSQVRRYSPFSGIREAIAWILTSFTNSAPKDVSIVIKNHPLDNGMIRYDRYIDRFAKACGISSRVIFLEEGNGNELIERSLGLVLINSTMGLQALQMGKAVFCLGQSIYARKGMALNTKISSLDDFWKVPQKPNQEAVKEFVSSLKKDQVVNGNFYTEHGIEVAAELACKRLLGENS